MLKELVDFSGVRPTIVIFCWNSYEKNAEIHMNGIACISIAVNEFWKHKTHEIILKIELKKHIDPIGIEPLYTLDVYFAI